MDRNLTDEDLRVISALFDQKHQKLHVDVAVIKNDIAGIKSQFTTLNGSVNRHQSDIQNLKVGTAINKTKIAMFAGVGGLGGGVLTYLINLIKDLTSKGA